MNILMVSPFDLVSSRLWGPTVRLHSLAKEMGKQGHKVVLAGPPPFGGERPRELDGVEMHYFKVPFHRYDYPEDDGGEERRKRNLRRKLPYVLFNRFWEIKDLLKRRAINILYVNRAFLDTAYPAYFAGLLTRRIIVCDWDDLEGLHGFSTSFRLPLHRQLFETFNELSFARLADFTVVSSNQLREFALNIGVKPEKLFYARTVADTDKFSPAVDGKDIRSKFGLQGKKILFYCGNLMKGNGVKVENAIYTLKRVLEKDPSFVLLIVGDGDLISKDGRKGELVELAESLNIADKVIFAGSVPYVEVPKYVAAADMCLALFPINLITLTKSPLKIYEYMSAGKAVLARDVGEISQCIEDAKNGILVYSDSPDEYSDKILEFFSDKQLLTEIGRNARQTIEERFAWRQSAEIVINACEKNL